MTTTDMINNLIAARAAEIIEWVKDFGYGKDEAIEIVKNSSTLGNGAWQKVLEIVNQSI